MTRRNVVALGTDVLPFSDSFSCFPKTTRYPNMTAAAFKAVLAEHEGRLSYMVQPFSNCGVDREDLLQEARVALWRAAEKWDETRGASLWTFARRKVFGALVDLTTRQAEEPSAPNSSPDSILANFDVDGAPAFVPSFEDSIVDHETSDEVRNAIARLSVADQTLLQSYVKAGNYASLGPELGLTADAVSKKVKRVVERIRDNMKGAA